MKEYVRRMISEKSELSARIARAKKAVEHPPYGMTATNTIESGNNQPVTSDAVYNKLSSKAPMASLRFSVYGNTGTSTTFDISSAFNAENRVMCHFKVCFVGNSNRLHVAEGCLAVWSISNVTVQINYKGSYINDITLDARNKTLTIKFSEDTYGGILAMSDYSTFSITP